MRRLRALVVDDEEPARRRLLELLEQREGWEALDSIDNGVDAVEVILDRAPDLVLLDIQMPEVDGFDVLRQVGAARMPPVIFVTAYDEHALRAFEASAVDYLLKPFTDDRFERALRRCEERIRLTELGATRERMVELLEALADREAPARREPRAAATRPSGATRIPVQTKDRTLLLPAGDIDYVRADGPYMRLHVGERDFLIRERMHLLADKLAPERFLRIHRSTLVNLDRVAAIEPYFRGEAFVRLEDGHKLKVSRSRRAELYEALGMTEPDDED